MNKIFIAIGAFILLLIIITVPRSFDKSDFTVNSVLDGNTILLENGYQVVLLGVSGSDKSFEYLQKYVKQDIRLVMDASSPRLSGGGKAEKRIYAYVKYQRDCLNSNILKEKLSDICVMPNLTDSLDSYIVYSGKNRDEIIPYPEPEPEPDPIPDGRVKPNGGENDGGDSEGDDGHGGGKGGKVTPHKGTRQNGWSMNCSGNLDMLEDVVDFKNPTTRNYAVNLASKSPGNYNFGQVCAIFDQLYTKWKYVNDPQGAEYVAKASESISASNLSGDCDDFAVTMCACIIAIGGEARINTAWGPQGGHAFTEVDVTGLNETNMKKTIRRMFKQYAIGSLNTRVENGRTWLNLDWQASYPGGPYFRYSDCNTYQRSGGTSWSCR